MNKLSFVLMTLFLASCAKPSHKVVRNPYFITEQEVEKNKEEESRPEAQTEAVQPEDLDLNEDQQEEIKENQDKPDGKIIPTVYYVPQIELGKCAPNEKLLPAKEYKSKEPVVYMCESQLKLCKLQGSCLVTKNKKKMSLNFAKSPPNEYLFRVNTFLNCKFAKGATGECLTAFYSIAADPNIYKMNQKIFIPEIKGLILPDGTTHNGVFLIQDTGGKIKGHGRFDFFTGFMNHNDKKNPLSKAGLADKKTRMDFFLINE